MVAIMHYYHTLALAYMRSNPERLTFVVKQSMSVSIYIAYSCDRATAIPTEVHLYLCIYIYIYIYIYAYTYLFFG